MKSILSDAGRDGEAEGTNLSLRRNDNLLVFATLRNACLVRV
jgi:hypothetical protein